MVFVNFSNHPSDNWSRKQIEAASNWGKIEDLPFPEVPADATREEIQLTASRCVDQIIALDPEVVMCQGEFTLAYAVITRLKEKGITVVAACSERKVIESCLEDGTCQKTSKFEFIRFREY